MQLNYPIQYYTNPKLYLTKDYPPDSASISDDDNKVFLKFLRRLNDADLQTAPTPRPGSDVTSCLRQLRVAR